MNAHTLRRRDLLRAGAAAGLSLGLSDLFPAWAQTGSAGLQGRVRTLTGDTLSLVVDHAQLRVSGRTGHAITINGTVPAPLLRLREGQRVRIEVDNRLDEQTSIHWHGLIVPFEMDGVPGVSFPGVKPRSTFTYEVPVRQSAPTGITAIVGTRNSLVITARSSSIPPGRTRLPSIASM